MDKITLEVEGMKCSGCENRIIKSLMQDKKISEVVASHQENKVVVTGSNLDINQIGKKIEALGFIVK